MHARDVEDRPKQTTSKPPATPAAQLPPDVASELVKLYCKRLRGYVVKKLSTQVRQKVGGTDEILQRIWKSFLSRLGKGPHPQPTDDLWLTLALFAKRKCLKAVREVHAGKRDVRREQPLIAELHDGAGAHAKIAIPSSDEAEAVLEEIRALEEPVQTIVLKKIEGYTNAEIADQLGISERTVRRHLADLRRRWEDGVDE
jgi:RNA polymerase sigma factor (sigma-70 family)